MLILAWLGPHVKKAVAALVHFLVLHLEYRGFGILVPRADIGGLRLHVKAWPSHRAAALRHVL